MIYLNASIFLNFFTVFSASLIMNQYTHVGTTGGTSCYNIIAFLFQGNHTADHEQVLSERCKGHQEFLLQVELIAAAYIACWLFLCK